MNKKIIVCSWDDCWEGNVNLEIFENFHNKFSDFKATFFVNPGQCSDSFLKKIKQDWIELVYHCENHSGGFKNWTKDEAKKYLLKYHEKYNFVKGFKAPGWKITQNIIDACKELDFWVASISTVPVDIEKKFYTYYKKGEGLNHLENYSEYYGHFQSYNFNENFKELEKHCIEYNPTFKFVSQMLI